MYEFPEMLYRLAGVWLTFGVLMTFLVVAFRNDRGGWDEKKGEFTRE